MIIKCKKNSLSLLGVLLSVPENMCRCLEQKMIIFKTQTEVADS
jgi:hypothetical protein